MLMIFNVALLYNGYLLQNISDLREVGSAEMFLILQLHVFLNLVLILHTPISRSCQICYTCMHFSVCFYWTQNVNVEVERPLFLQSNFSFHIAQCSIRPELYKMQTLQCNYLRMQCSHAILGSGFATAVI